MAISLVEASCMLTITPVDMEFNGILFCSADSSHLRLERVKDENAGTYTCVAFNDVSFTSETTEVIVTEGILKVYLNFHQ